MRQLLLSICFLAFYSSSLFAQSGCPGCVVQLPGGLPADTLFLQALPDGIQDSAYNHDISFRVPTSTTPVNAIDSTTPPGFPISKIEIVSVDGLPPGLSWEANQLIFETATQTDGCIKICGTPTKSDSFILTVKLKATVLVFTQEATFPMRMYIAPKVSTTDGFSMSNFTGCGSATVSFINNIPSGGNPGITYEWDFGDGTTSTEENPAPHTYNQTGIYEVNYHATIDTVGFQLVSATVLGVAGCTDQAGLGDPDLYLFILDANGQEIFNSSPEINNTDLPHTFPIGLEITPGTYRMEVWDEDSGLEGSDDPCGQIYFNNLNDGDTITAGAFRVVIHIDHPVEEVFSSDTVQVYAQPAQPSITANALAACAGSGEIVLQSSFGAGNQWWQNGQPLSGAVDFLYMPATSGYYQVEVITSHGCSAISDSTWVEFYPLPAVPQYLNDRNNLELIDTLALPATYSLQWYLFAEPLPGANGFTLCAQVDGEYTLEVTDQATGCTNEYVSNITVDPQFDCLVGASEAAFSALVIFPNPATEQVTVQLPEVLAAHAQLRIWDVAGRLVQQIPVGPVADRIIFDLGSLNAGSYLLEVDAGGQRFIGRVIMIR